MKKGDPWSEAVLYVFKGNADNDGASPFGGLAIDSAGNLYGTTAYGGTGDCMLLGSKLGCGTVFELSPPKQRGGKWSETVLYSFPTAKQGYVPWGDLVFDNAGNLYGATEFGGGRGATCNGFYQYCGAVFELSPPKKMGGKWTEKVLYGFRGVAAGARFGDGANPNGGLVFDNKGAIYGTTIFGGNNVKGKCQGGVGGTGCGVVFSLRPPMTKGGVWTEKKIHIFSNGDDGFQPGAGVILDAQGSLYGGAEGGAKAGGVVFKLAATTDGSWKETVLHEFKAAADGGYDPSVVRFDRAGNLNGTTNVGPGESLAGSVFSLKPPLQKRSTWPISILHGFTNTPDGAFPGATLSFDRSGSICGATQFGGAVQFCQRGCGTVYEVSP